MDTGDKSSVGVGSSRMVGSLKAVAPLMDALRVVVPGMR
jgi:hypothetical protein